MTISVVTTRVLKGQGLQSSATKQLQHWGNYWIIYQLVSIFSKFSDLKPPSPSLPLVRSRHEIKSLWLCWFSTNPSTEYCCRFWTFHKIANINTFLLFYCTNYQNVGSCQYFYNFSINYPNLMSTSFHLFDIVKVYHSIYGSTVVWLRTKWCFWESASQLIQNNILLNQNLSSLWPYFIFDGQTLNSQTNVFI